MKRKHHLPFVKTMPGLGSVKEPGSSQDVLTGFEGSTVYWGGEKIGTITGLITMSLPCHPDSPSNGQQVKAE